MIDLNFMLKSESRVDSFFKADQKERKLAEYYYPVKALKELVMINIIKHFDLLMNISKKMLVILKQ